MKQLPIGSKQNPYFSKPKLSNSSNGRNIDNNASSNSSNGFEINFYRPIFECRRLKTMYKVYDKLVEFRPSDCMILRSSQSPRCVFFLLHKTSSTCVIKMKMEFKLTLWSRVIKRKAQ